MHGSSLLIRSAGLRTTDGWRRGGRVDGRAFLGSPAAPASTGAWAGAGGSAAGACRAFVFSVGGPNPNTRRRAVARRHAHAHPQAHTHTKHARKHANTHTKHARKHANTHTKHARKHANTHTKHARKHARTHAPAHTRTQGRTRERPRPRTNNKTAERARPYDGPRQSPKHDRQPLEALARIHSAPSSDSALLCMQGWVRSPSHGDRATCHAHAIIEKWAAPAQLVYRQGMERATEGWGWEGVGTERAERPGV
jgi:hypothetical protein